VYYNKVIKPSHKKCRVSGIKEIRESNGVKRSLSRVHSFKIRSRIVQCRGRSSPSLPLGSATVTRRKSRALSGREIYMRPAGTVTVAGAGVGAGAGRWTSHWPWNNVLQESIRRSGSRQWPTSVPPRTSPEPRIFAAAQSSRESRREAFQVLRFGALMARPFFFYYRSTRYLRDANGLRTKSALLFASSVPLSITDLSDLLSPYLRRIR
jgi:hypothetical protein